MSLLVGRSVRRSVLTIATEDHNIPTVGSIEPIVDPVSRAQVEALRANAPEFGVPPLGDADQGVVHIIGPQLGLTQPGMTVVCVGHQDPPAGSSHNDGRHGGWGSA